MRDMGCCHGRDRRVVIVELKVMMKVIGIVVNGCRERISGVGL